MSSRRMRRRSTSVLLTALLVLASAALPSARDFRTVEYGALKVTIDSDWAPRLAPGYLPVRFDLTNSGDAREVEIIGRGSRYFRPAPRPGSSPPANGSFIVRQVIRLAAGDHVRLTIPIPIFADSENVQFEIRENDKPLDRFSYDGFQSHIAARDASVLLVADPTSPFGAMVSRIGRTLGGRRPPPLVSGTGAAAATAAIVSMGSSRPSLDFVLDPARLPTNWIGFTSLRAVVISAVEWGELSDAQKGALLGWTSAGGELIFLDGELSALVPAAQAAPATDPTRGMYHQLFGRIHTMSLATLSEFGLGKTIASLDASTDMNWALPVNTAPDFGAIERRGFRLPIPGIEGVPARVYLSILVLFSLLIGPANYWFLWRKKRQVLLVLTVPLISVVFIALLTGYAIAGEGFSVKGRASTFTLLDQTNRQAVTRSSVSLYAAGLTPPGGLRVARDTALFPLGPDGAGIRDRLDLDLTEMQSFTSGVLQARSPTNFEEVTVRPARERLTFAPDAGGLSVTNGLESSVRLVLYRDGDTLYQLVGPLAPGATQVLAVVDVKQALPAGLSFPSKLLYLVQNQPRGSFLAVLERSPFWDSGLSAVIERNSFHLVLGFPEGRR